MILKRSIFSEGEKIDRYKKAYINQETRNGKRSGTVGGGIMGTMGGNIAGTALAKRLAKSGKTKGASLAVLGGTIIGGVGGALGGRVLGGKSSKKYATERLNDVHDMHGHDISLSDYKRELERKDDIARGAAQNAALVSAIASR